LHGFIGRQNLQEVRVTEVSAPIAKEKIVKELQRVRIESKFQGFEQRNFISAHAQKVPLAAEHRKEKEVFKEKEGAEKM